MEEKNPKTPHRIPKTTALAMMAFAAAMLLQQPHAMSAEKQQHDPCGIVTNALIEKHAPLKDYHIISKEAVHQDICQVVVSYEGSYIPLYVNKDYLMIGDYFSNQSHPTVKAIETERTKDFAKSKEDLEKAVAFSYKPKKATRHIYFITDPDCPACNNNKKAIKRFADQNSVEIKVIFYPMPMHPKARDKSSAAICANITYDDYIRDRYPPTTCKKGDEKIKEAITTLDNMQIEGTPTFITDTGNKLLGYDPEELKKLL